MGRKPTYSQVIPDSEDEEELTIDSEDLRNEVSEISSIQPFTASMDRPTTRVDQISSFTEDIPFSLPPIAALPEPIESPAASNSTRNAEPGPVAVPASLLRGPSISAIGSATGSVPPKPRPRPKPRPAYKGPSAPSSISKSTPVARDPVPSFQPDTAAPSSSIPGLNFDKAANPEEPYMLDIAERAKLRSRSSKSKSKEPAIAPADIIELSSDSEDELSLIPPKRKGKTKAAAKRSPAKKSKVTHETEIPDSTLISLPVATSESDLPPDAQLPPSDPPHPSISSGLRASKSPTRAAPSGPVPDVSPLSSPLPPPPRRRKRPVSPARPPNSEPEQEPVPPPPPPFFASSSSAPVPSSASELLPSSPTRPPAPKKNVPKPKGRKRKAVQSDDESDWEGEKVPPPKPKPKARGRKRNAAEDDEEEWHGDEPPKAKPKPKPKPKRKANKKKQTEVVVEVDPPPQSRRTTNSVSPAKHSTDAPDTKITSPVRGAPASADRVIDTSPISGKTSSRASKAKQSLPADDDLANEVESPKPASSKSKGKKRALPSDEEEPIPDNPAPLKKSKSTNHKSPSITPQETHETPIVDNGDMSAQKDSPAKASTSATPQNKHAPSSSALRGSVVVTDRRYNLPRRDHRSMAEIIRKVNSQPGSPFGGRPAHTPLAKMSRSAFMNVVPLHRNRKTPPPPPPRPPPPKKTKKQIELEEKWEMELEDTVDGWYCLTEEERAQLRRAKRDKEMGYDD